MQLLNGYINYVPFIYTGVPEPHISTLYIVSQDEIDDTVLTGIIVIISSYLIIT